MQNFLNNITLIIFTALSSGGVFLSSMIVNAYFSPSDSSAYTQNLSLITLTTIIVGFGMVSSVFQNNWSDEFLLDMRRVHILLVLISTPFIFTALGKILVIASTVNLIYYNANYLNLEEKHFQSAFVRSFYPILLLFSVLCSLILHFRLNIFLILSLSSTLWTILFAFRIKYRLPNIRSVIDFFFITTNRLSLQLSDLFNFLTYRSIFTFVFPDHDLIKGYLFSSLLICEVLYLIPNALVPKLCAVNSNLTAKSSTWLNAILLYILMAFAYFLFIEVILILVTDTKWAPSFQFVSQLYIPVFLMGILKFLAPFFYKYDAVKFFWFISLIGGMSFLYSTYVSINIGTLDQIFREALFYSVSVMLAASGLVIWLKSR